MGAPLKQIKKVKEIRHFHFGSSVYKNFKLDNKRVIDEAFEHDKKLTKLPKFIKDPEDLDNTFNVFKKNYGALKNQFVSQIANPKSYPVIDWLDFVEACDKWGIIDKYLTSQDIDRIFIATNFEEEDLEENDDSSLCRFEFMEIMARMAKIKYVEKKFEENVSDALERLLRNYILPNTIEHMEWQPFREQYLWNLDLDDLFKANTPSIQILFKKYLKLNQKHLSLEDLLSMVKDSAIPLSDK